AFSIGFSPRAAAVSGGAIISSPTDVPRPQAEAPTVLPESSQAGRCPLARHVRDCARGDPAPSVQWLAMAPTPADAFVAVVRSALRHTHDHRQLDRIPLAPRGAIATGRHGRALQTALRDAISWLSPPGAGASLLRLRYLDRLALGVSRSEY